MKTRLLSLSTVALGVLALTACGGGTTTGGGTITPPPTSTYPYNPNASSTQATDTRVPYRGDWVLVAHLGDNTDRRGLISINAVASDATFLNAGGGVGGWCVSSTGCSQNTEVGTALIGSQGGKLSVGLVPRDGKTARFYFTDTDGEVTVSNGLPVIAGSGTWTLADGTQQTATFALVQSSSTPAVKASSLQMNTAQQVATQVISQQQLQIINNAPLAQALTSHFK